ncbi:hypothetical protein [Burkholderia anthina]|uniref:hypothetical protein n=1 Tax=Burkholderia anthina TaxID=179879 RepID=UPI00158AAE02|nr:hypothetical protein [Burkholderia anthina]
MYASDTDSSNFDTGLRVGVLRMGFVRAGFAATAPNLSAFLWARRLNNRLSARQRKPLAEQDSKLVHR